MIPRSVAPGARRRAESPAAVAVGRPSEGPASPQLPTCPRRRPPMIAATQMRVGNIILHNGKPHRVTAVVHRTPGNLRGFVQATLVNIENGSKNEHRFSSEDKVERATLEEHKLQFSYRAADEFHFMNTETYEMISLDKEILGDAVGYLLEGMVITALYFEGRVVGIEVPMFVEMVVKETTPNIKGAAVQNTSKPAILETGLEIKVPPYIEEGNVVKVDTRTGEFVERV
uniref:Elongation factor P n=1 Tax=Eiseniibacteriota bacterium TaxID=2212470 RepID=A0A832MM03_UNCEI